MLRFTITTDTAIYFIFLLHLMYCNGNERCLQNIVSEFDSNWLPYSSGFELNLVNNNGLWVTLHYSRQLYFYSKINNFMNRFNFHHEL